MAARRQPDGAENAASPLLPGGSLLAAALDRQVMIWSDRGGASGHIGDRWAMRCDSALQEAVGGRWSIPHDEDFEILDVVRLDDVPEVSREANLNHLENPDFLLIGARNGRGRPVLQAADAKFAPDRIRPSQVSAEIVGNLLALKGATHRIVEDTFAAHGLRDPELVRGVFISPESEMSEFLLRRVTSGRRATVDPAEVILIPPHPDRLFAGLPESKVIGPLARLDALPVTPRGNLISAIYYFRLSCACFHFWNEEHRPLLALAPSSPPEPGMVSAIVSLRAEQSASAYELVERWSIDIEPQVRARSAIAEVATLPVGIRELRTAIDAVGLGGDNKALRLVRRDLESAFRSRLHESVGDILADDPRPLSQILEAVASASRGLRTEMLALMHERIAAAETTLRSSTSAS